MPRGYQIIDDQGNAVGVVDGKLKANVTVGAVSAGEIFGWDSYPSGWILLGGTITADDWVKITIDGYDSQYTIQGGDTWVDVVAGLVAAVNANSNVNAKVEAKAQYKIVFIHSKEAGDQYEALTLATSVSGSATITASAGYSTIRQLFKKILIERDAVDGRYGRIGVFGEVGARTKADNPIHICVKKSVATTNELIFADKTVPATERWFVTNVAVADERAAEFNLYNGVKRGKVELFSGDAAEDTFTLINNAIDNANYIVITIGGTPTTAFSLEQNSSDEAKTDVVFDDPPASGTNNISVTYDAVKQALALMVQADASQPFEFGAPLKVEPAGFVIMSVKNKAANAATVIANLNGFFEAVD